ncbi:MAG: hypothetical protein WBB74_02920 [Gaiellaceae bacterium]
MKRARRHQRLLAVLAFGLLALVGELAGQSLSQRLNFFGRNIASPSYSSESYYPFMLAAVKIGIALLLARLAWRFVKARSAARAGRRLLAAVGARPSREVPRVRLSLSPRLWFMSFAVTSLFYLLQTDAEGLSAGVRWPLLTPWLHTSALPVFAVLAVLMAFVWGVVARWLADYESYAEATCAHARRITADSPCRPSRSHRDVLVAPRHLFGLAFESRPPPLPA